MSDHAQKHPFHLVDPSPWPLVASLSAGLFTGGMVYFMHSDRLLTDFWLAAIGIAGILFVMFRWWGDVVRESRIYHNPVVQIGLRYGMSLFIASEVMFFVAFFWAFFQSALLEFNPAITQWPPAGIEVLDPWDLPFINTLVLLLSGCTLTWAHHACLEGDKKHMVQGLTLTVLLGIAFLACQAYEYHHAAFAFDEGIYPSTFYMATGFHGFHVFVGTVFLAVCLYRANRGDFKPDHHFGLEAAAWYWHFVDVVWLFLFFSVYIWGGQ
ncbi:cytochrome B562 [Thalassospira profundimaris]|uniref:Cytochrome c oxidase subunit 3 n=1 Tax=Thalassospira profundimaris TaxID=502049 RepID=A0A367X0C7_9PROT|nr:cytochrome c oxidase subunit 3 [Thalassospira profundimaris]RCK47098.1 cytochrome B562 [Thalassospira profundimaris]